MKSKLHSPIAIFIYNRPRHIERLLNSLAQCYGIEDSDLYIFADGPKEGQDKANIIESRDIAANFDKANSIELITVDKNQGLANSIIQGVTRLVNDYGRVIVLEDDLILAPGFLRFMNQALDRYQDESQVMQISGHMFPVKVKTKEDSFFMPFTTSWGWATWKRAWDLFDVYAIGWQKLLKDGKLRKSFNLDNSYDYTRMLLQQMEGNIDSWAIRWYWSVFKQGGVVLFPKSTFVINDGMDGSGTHCGNKGLNIYNTDIFEGMAFKECFSVPQEICESVSTKRQIIKYFKNKLGVYQRIKMVIGW